jgi:hypothetical protein
MGSAIPRQRSKYWIREDGCRGLVPRGTRYAARPAPSPADVGVVERPVGSAVDDERRGASHSRKAAGSGRLFFSPSRGQQKLPVWELWRTSRGRPVDAVVSAASPRPRSRAHIRLKPSPSAPAPAPAPPSSRPRSLLPPPAAAPSRPQSLLQAPPVCVCSCRPSPTRSSRRPSARPPPDLLSRRSPPSM